MLDRIAPPLNRRAVFARFTPGEIATEYKSGHDPVTEAETRWTRCCARICCATAKAGCRKKRRRSFAIGSERVWVVDPLDGTREFVEGIPEFCVSIGMVEHGRPVAGGIYNPATNETFLGAVDAASLTTASPPKQGPAPDWMAVSSSPVAAK